MRSKDRSRCHQRALLRLGRSAATRAATLKSIFKTPLMYKPGTKTVYSDVDYMLLAFAIEAITGKGLDAS